MSPHPRTPDQFDDQSVVVSVEIAATPETVWRFLSEADRFAAWIGAFAGQPPLPGTAVTPRPGGAIRVAYPGENSAGVGEITAMEPLKRVAFTWGYDSGKYDMTAGSTQVEITLQPVADGTRVTLRHTGLPNRDTAQGHFGGWKHYLSMLARQASEVHHAGSLPRVLEAYFAAWNEPDAAARRTLLQTCCEPGISVRSSWACTDGIDELSAHISNGLKHMPGMSLRQDGPPQALHGSVRVGWTIRAPNGQDVMRGANVARLGLSGKLTTLVSFPAI
jgi:uncharacterized protein YndB with AHSA1/START domain